MRVSVFRTLLSCYIRLAQYVPSHIIGSLVAAEFVRERYSPLLPAVILVEGAVYFQSQEIQQ